MRDVDVDTSGGSENLNPYSRPTKSTGGSYIRKSATYDQPFPIVYGTAAVKALPLISGIDSQDHTVALDGGEPTAMRCAYVAFALGVGPVSAIESILYEKRRYAAASGTGVHAYKYLSHVVAGAWPTPPEIFLGDGTTTAWSGFPDPTQWKSMALFRCNFMGVPGGAGKVPELRAVVRGLKATQANNKRNADGLFTRYDAPPGDVIRDLLENAVYGLGLTAGTVVTSVGADGLAASSYDRYCQENGWLIALAIDASVSVAEIIQQILTATNSVGFWSGANFKIIPLGDSAVGTYSPVLTAISLTEDDFVAPDGADAIRVTRRAWADTYNVVPVEYSQDTALWDSELTQVEAMDGASVATYGVRRAPSTVSLPCIRSKAHAVEISGILARRSCYNRSLFEFTITARQGTALEAGDLVALTHSCMGLTTRLARVERVEATPGSGTYRVEAREWTTGASVTVLVTPEGSRGLGNNPVPAGDTYGPVIAMGDDGKLTPVEKPAFFDAVQNIWHGVREGGAAGSGDTPFGGTSLNAASLTFHNYLNLSLGFDYAWVDIDRVWSDPGDRSAQRALLATWMGTTTDVVAADFRAAFNAVTTAITDARAWILKPTALGSSVARTLPERFADVVNVRDRGAAGNGTTDDTQAFLDALATGTDVYVPAGTYKITAPLHLHSNQEICGEHGAALTGNFADWMFKTSGTSGSVIRALSAAVALLAKSVTVSSAAGFSPGDMVLIYDSVLDEYEVNAVSYIVDQTLHLLWPVAQEFLTPANATVQKVTPVENAVIRGLKLTNSHATGGTVYWLYGRGCKVVENHFTDAGYLSVTANVCLSMTTSGNRIRNGAKSAVGYRVSHGGAIQNNDFENNRQDEPITLYKSNTHTVVTGNRISQQTQDGAGVGGNAILLDQHNYFNTIVGNAIVGCPTYSIFLYDHCSFNVIVGNTVNRTLLGCITLKVNCDGNYIDGNVCTGVMNATDPYLGGGPTYAIYVDSSCKDNWVGPGNQISDVAGGAFAILQSDSSGRVRLPLGVGTSKPYGLLDVRGGSATVTTEDFAAGSVGTAIEFGLGAATGNTYGALRSGTGGGGAPGPIVLQADGGQLLQGKTASQNGTNTELAGSLSCKASTDAVTLGVNYAMTFEFVDNTHLRIKMRGADGTTRSVTLTLS